MLITRGFGYNSGGTGTGENVYINVQDPSIITFCIEEAQISTKNNVPILNLEPQIMKPSLLSKEENSTITINLLKPSLYIQED